MTAIGDLCQRFAESCPAVAGIQVGEAVSEAIWYLGKESSGVTAARPRSVGRKLRAAADLARAAGEWGWREVVDGLVDRQDPSHAFGARFLKPSTVEHADLLCTSTYENTARAVLRYTSELPARTVLGASRWRAESEWKAAGASAFNLASLLRGEGRAVRARAVKMAASFSVGLRAIEGQVRGDRREALGALSASLEGAIASGLAGFTIALEKAIARYSPGALAVGNEFAFTDRAALLLARREGLATVAFAHGIFDCHYVDIPVLADLFVAWGSASERYLLESGLSSPNRVVSVRPVWESPRPQEGPRKRVVVFTQPVRFSGVTPDNYGEGVRSLCRLLAQSEVEVVLKPHPLEQVSEWRGVAAKVVGRRTGLAEVLDGAFAAVLLDSSVIVDVLLTGVPAVGIGWCDSAYGARFEREGWMVRCSSPEEGAERLLEMRRGPRAVADPLAGETPGGRERLRATLSGRMVSGNTADGREGREPLAEGPSE